jgi:hypothetical protein
MNRGEDIVRILEKEFPDPKFSRHQVKRMIELLDIAIKEAYEIGQAQAAKQKAK